MSRLAISIAHAVADVPAADWDALAGAGHPFVRHAFLDALEASGSATASNGWAGSHLVARDEAGALVGLVPCWLKSHSWGEYVFDHPWADAYRRAGLRYYPKALAAIPFTPVPGPRLLARDPEVRPVLVKALEELVRAGKLSSAHVNFVGEADAAALRSAGWLLRSGFQFHWENKGYRSFDDFLGALTSHRRKELRRERRQALSTGLTLRRLRGGEISPELWRAFHRLYLAQSDKKWGSAYLTESFFPMVGARLGEDVVLACAFAGEELVAGAINFQGADTLYGRNWATSVDVPGLHFEVCYHQAIEHAIEHGLARVEAGAQGEHKLQRGYLPTRTYSAHFLADRRFATAIGDWLERETAGVEEMMATYQEHSPYRAG